jgi:hypothetical protein
VDSTIGLRRIVGGPGAGTVEHGDASREERAIQEINSSVYVFDYGRLTEALAGLRRDNRQGELYLTDTIAALRTAGGTVGALKAATATEVLGINDHTQLREAERLYRASQPPEPERKRPPRMDLADDEDETAWERELRGEAAAREGAGVDDAADEEADEVTDEDAGEVLDEVASAGAGSRGIDAEAKEGTTRAMRARRTTRTGRDDEDDEGTDPPAASP